MSSRRHARGSAAGNIITLLLLVGIVGLGAWLWLGKRARPRPGATAQRAPARTPADNGVPEPRATRPSPSSP